MKLHHVALTVKDLEQSVGFYATNFNLSVAFRFERQDMGAAAVFLTAGNSHLELWAFHDKKIGELTDLGVTGIKHIAFQSEDIESDYARLVSNGLACQAVKEGKSGGKYFFTHDLDGNQIEIYQNPLLKI